MEKSKESTQKQQRTQKQGTTEKKRNKNGNTIKEINQ